MRRSPLDESIRRHPASRKHQLAARDMLVRNVTVPPARRSAEVVRRGDAS